MNLCIFSGRLTKDTETRYTQSGKSVCNFSLAVDTGYGDNKQTIFMNCVLWNKEKLAQHLTKGKPVIVSGEYTERKYQDKDGNERKISEIIVRDVEFQQGQPLGQGRQEQSQSQPKQAHLSHDTAPPSEYDEIPF